MVTKKLLHELFEYKDGELYWKKSPSKIVKAGSKAGFLNSNNRKQVKIFQNHYLIHRVIFMMFYGWLPEFIDHIDNNQLNNKIENLRPATRSQNQCNRKTQKSLSGIKGITWCNSQNKWRASFQLNKKKIHVGRFDSLEKAKIAIIEFRSKYHGNFAKH